MDVIDEFIDESMNTRGRGVYVRDFFEFRDDHCGEYYYDVCLYQAVDISRASSLRHQINTCYMCDDLGSDYKAERDSREKAFWEEYRYCCGENLSDYDVEWDPGLRF